MVKLLAAPNQLTRNYHLNGIDMQDPPKLVIQKCIKGERASQKILYTQLAPRLMVVCLRYSASREDAEEILQEGFMKVFDNLSRFRFNGSFEGWARKIIVNTALQRYRCKPSLHIVSGLTAFAEHYPATPERNTYSQLDVKDLVRMVQQLPPAYRMVFNLYIFEKMKHREIAAHLGISEGTSKSNLSDAKAILQKAVINSEKTAKQYAY